MRFHLGHVLSLLVESSLERRKFAALYSSIKNRAYLDQYCTIRMGTARGSGHTTALVQVAKEYFSKPLFVTPNVMMSNCVKGIAGDMRLEGANFMSVEQVKRSFARDCDAILVDCAFMLSNGQRDAIEEHAMACLPGHPDFCLIYVQ